ncbi:MAG TPA: hypothetical protein VIV40_42925 [Kofleriaceae bacterium]
MRLWIGSVLLLSAGSARADHVHTVEHADHAFGAGVSMLAAAFDTTLYVGNYQGVVPSLHWSNDRFAAGASVALYRLERNGASVYGFGDIVVHGQATLVGDHDLHAGVIVAASAPIGDELRGMGMGHPMVMPAAFGVWTLDRVGLSATAGYSRALGANAEHDHGMWPLVEPMNMVELTWSAGGAYAVTPHVQAGARFSGGYPIGNGDNRVVGALRVGYASGRYATAAELQAGLAGDPFTVRGVVSTALSF